MGGSGCSCCTSGGCAHSGTAFLLEITMGSTKNSRTHVLLTVSRSAGNGTVCNVSSAFLRDLLPWLFGLLPRPTPAAARSARAALFASIFALCFSLRMVFRGAPAYRSTQAKRDVRWWHTGSEARGFEAANGAPPCVWHARPWVARAAKLHTLDLAPSY